MTRQKGNALFLILIAVALFAALAYAVTQSGRGGGGTISQEQMQIDVARVMQQAALIEITNTRLLLNWNASQIKFRNLPYATGATSYPNHMFPPDRSEAVANAYTIGMFNPEEGIPPPIVPTSLTSASNPSTFGWVWFYNLPMRVNGVDVGTSLGDEFLTLSVPDSGAYITQTACNEINRRLTGDPAILTYNIFAITPSGVIDWLWQNGTVSGQNHSSGYDLPTTEGCFVRGGRYIYFRLIRAF